MDDTKGGSISRRPSLRPRLMSPATAHGELHAPTYHDLARTIISAIQSPVCTFSSIKNLVQNGDKTSARAEVGPSGLPRRGGGAAPASLTVSCTHVPPR